MKRTAIKQMALAVVTTLLVASCASEDMMDGTVQDLPEGKYPLEISAVSVTGDVQSRVSENTTDGNSSAWDWDGNEQIGVSVNETSATYTLNANKTISSDAPLYWSNTAEATVTASYPATDGAVNLADQSSGLKYIMTGTGTGSYTKGVSLAFTHQLAKVWVKLSGEKATDVTAVQVYSYTSCTHTQGASVTGSTEGWITMHQATYNEETCWEANVVPGYTIAKAKVNEKECELTTTVTPEAGKWNEVTINVEKVPVEIQLGTDGNYTVKDGDKVIINGNGTESTASINITGTATVILNNVNLKNASKKNYVPVQITDGTATIILKGENTIIGGAESASTSSKDGAGIQLSNENSHVIIKVTTGSKLNVSAGWGCAAIGGKNGGVCGNIRIESATIVANTANNYAVGAGAAIGSGAAYFSKAGCGTIIIIDSDITASVTEVSTGNKPAVIGSGYADYDCNYSNSCKGISITLKAGQTKSDFLSKLTGVYNVQVGAGEENSTTPNTCDYINWYNADGTPAN